ncbi:NAD(P)-binding protein [Lentinula guzmanii]|uniref:NAD(P)-binding protein n=1 Tax=Lentinula guzmanii TaxID=2804957 RepID=A0AA38MXH4_9AGAR|nr:NAD(P)-binding protein [Lentinula guzmanii]
MRSSNSLSKIKAENAKISFSYIPVAVFVGGTSGIGRGIAEAFARHTKGNAHIIIVGRNRAAAESIIASFPQPTSPTAKHEFIECDVSLLKNVRQVTSEILNKHAKLNFLVLSAGALDHNRTRLTEDGIDPVTALSYHSRWKLIYDLAPALEKARNDNEDAKVLSVLSAGNGGKIDLSDLELKKASLMTWIQSLMTYNDIMMDFSWRGTDSFRFEFCVPLDANMGLPCQLHPSLLSSYDTGKLWGVPTVRDSLYCWRIGKHGNDIEKQGYYGDDTSRDALWKHTMEVTDSK